MLLHPMRWVATVLLASLLAAGCRSQPPASPRTVVRVTKNTSIGEVLAREYARGVPTAAFDTVDVVGSVAAVDAIQRGRADLGVAFADVAYEAHVRAAERAEPGLGELRGMAALQVAPVHLLARAGVRISGGSDLRGHRVATGEVSTGQERLADLIFRAYRLDGEAVEGVSVAPNTVAKAISEGRVDAAFVTGYYPLASVSEAARHGARLVPLDGAPILALTREYPFLRRMVIPAHTYEDQTEVIRTLGVDRLLVCRSDLDDTLVYALTRRLFEALPRMPQFGRSSLRLMDLEQASATPIPLHAGAARYYRERELMR
jgi:TRAP transporter TAXI family solute receptor